MTTRRLVLTGVGSYLFTDLLALFLALTLAAIGGSIARLISCICTIGVMLVISVNFGLQAGTADRRRGRQFTALRSAAVGSCICAPFAVLGILLLLSRGGLLPDGFYRVYKICDAAFLQLCNYFSRDIVTSSLSWGAAVLLCAVNLLPLPAAAIAHHYSRVEI